MRTRPFLRATTRIAIAVFFISFSPMLCGDTVEEWIMRAYEGKDDPLYCATKAIEAEPDNPKGYYFRGLFVVENPHADKVALQKAVDDLDKALAIAPNMTQALVARADARAKLGNKESAEADIRRAEALRKASATYELQQADERIRAAPKDADTILNRGFVKMKNKDYRGAISDFDAYQAAVGKGNNMQVFVHKARAQELLGDVDAAIATLTEALHYFPEQARLYEQRSRLREIKGDREGNLKDKMSYQALVRKSKRESITELSESIARNPEAIYLLKKRAELFVQLGDYDLAEKDLENIESSGLTDIQTKRLRKKLKERIKQRVETERNKQKGLLPPENTK